MKKQSLYDFVATSPGAERDLLVTGLQALLRERVSAYNATCDACSLSGTTGPDRSVFGIDEVMAALRKLGAAPGW